MFQIARVELGDWLDTLEELDLKLFPDCKPYPKEFSHWWLAFHEGEPVGFSGLHIYKDCGTAFLCRAGVIKQYRGHGLQKRMIRVRDAYARKSGVNRIISYVAYGNVASANSLISCGYKLYIPKWEWGVGGCYYFQKIL